MAEIYPGVRLDLISTRHSICGLVLGILKVHKILCVASQIPDTWLFPFLGRLWALPVIGTL
jgi:hypothetical protein